MTSETTNKQHKQADQARLVRRFVVIALTVIVLGLAAAAVGGYFYLQSALSPVDEENEEDIHIEVPSGSSSAEIGDILEENDLIQNSTIFHYYVRYQNESGFQAGEYTLNQSMEIDEMIEALKEGRVEEEPAFYFIVPEGLWLEDIIEIIGEETPVEAEAFEETIEDETFLQEMIETYDFVEEEILDDEIKRPLEGYLFPDRYDFYEEEIGSEDIVHAMLEQMEAQLNGLTEQMEEKNASSHELLTLASIIEREAQTTEDRFKISGVLYNRLEDGMPLQVDPTVAYALDSHLYMTSYDDLEVDDPYNTYKYDGLPPGPIATSGFESMQAAVEPDEHEYLYFYARVGGEVLYSETFEEHDEIHQEYRDEWIEAQED
ncbi:UPF0755 protein [Salsuginibacillus halophilus]|uniref:Endolytic murein transglycosylase n=1 Tax=Salsuginibacillus halophilus TaxID=517424 RepID=A0A2P8HFU4_9BACI|nr:endolytic transglycosylase MltG [Salsuginibacillus halophilus]PSL45081.1 UPF0755 protein [Salsuginibacillus halophilus]